MTDRPFLNAASLLDLKAELLKKQESLKQTKLRRGAYEEVITSKLKRTDNDEQNKAGPKSCKTDQVLPSLPEEDLKLKKSREMLERKAALYEQICKGLVVPDEDQSERFLVNFQKKISEAPPPLESTDVQERTKDPPPHVEHRQRPDTTDRISSFGAGNTSDKPAPDGKQDVAPTPTEEQGGPIHYQNIQHKEVRNHGVGYFSFSMEEEERRKQMDSLNLLRNQTVDQRKALEKRKKKQQSKLKARLAKVRRRKNMISADTQEDSLEEESEELSEAEETEDLLAVTSEVKEVESKAVRVRPWDKGKELKDFLPEKRLPHKDPASQWLENKRSERLTDFAPPEVYSRRKEAINLHHRQKVVSLDSSPHQMANEEAARNIAEKISFIKKQYS